jgi:hypothetical protein
MKRKRQSKEDTYNLLRELWKRSKLFLTPQAAPSHRGAMTQHDTQTERGILPPLMQESSTGMTPVEMATVNHRRLIITVYFGGLAVCLNINKIQSRECNKLM